MILAGLRSMDSVSGSRHYGQLKEEYGVDSFTEMDDGSLLFEHEYADDEELLAWMLSCRDKITVLEPEKIREKLYRITSEIAKRYEGEKT